MTEQVLRPSFAIHPRAIDNDLLLRLEVSLWGCWDSSFPRRLPAVVQKQLGCVKTICLFVGYPRSGHSLVGSFIDAHPNAAIAHRLDALKYLKLGVSRERITYLMLRNSQRFARRGRHLTGYSYYVPDQWQGLFNNLHLVGDQEGNWTALRLSHEPDIVEILAAEGIQVRILHVIRNPFDNITTWARRSQASLDYTISRYFERCACVQKIRARLPLGAVLDVRHERFVNEFHTSFQDVLNFLSLSSDKTFRDACASILYKKTNSSRFSLEWQSERIKEVERRIQHFDFLSGYIWDA